MTDQPSLFDPHPRRIPAGEVRRALDRDIKAAEADGQTFREVDKAALRRQANDLDRLEQKLRDDPKAKTWDYQPKTAAHQAFEAAVRRFFREDTADDDPFARAVEELREAELRAAEVRDAEESEPAE